VAVYLGSLGIKVDSLKDARSVLTVKLGWRKRASPDMTEIFQFLGEHVNNRQSDANREHGRKTKGNTRAIPA
jgi:hypothetical protein